MVKKKIMILGASECQVPIISQAQEMGFEVVVVSIPGKYPGFGIADRFYEIDVRDQKQILKIAMDEQITGILTDQTDIPVTTVAYVAEHMGLPGIGYDCALRFTNKYTMRQYCERVGVPGPKHCQASSLQEACALVQQFQFPLVLKPVDSQGSRGVIKVNNLEELEDAFGKALVHSAEQQVILEEFFQGREVVIEGFMANEGFTNLVIGDRVYFDLPGIFVPGQTIFPSTVNPEFQQKLLALNTKLITGFAPKFGITHSEFLVNEETGEIRLVETAIRGGGVFISSDLIPLASSINPNELFIKYATGEKNISPIESSQVRQLASAYLCFYLPEGQILSIHGLEEVEAIDGVHKAFFDGLQVGQTTARLIDKTMRLGPILVAAENLEALKKIMTEVQDTLRIEVRTSDGIKNIVW